MLLVMRLMDRNPNMGDGKIVITLFSFTFCRRCKSESKTRRHAGERLVPGASARHFTLDSKPGINEMPRVHTEVSTKMVTLRC